MDTLTHALSGMLVTRASRPKQDVLPLWLASLAGFLVAAFPDIDFISRYFGITAFMTYHRSVTHSILLLPVWAGLLAVVLHWLTARRYSWQIFFPLCALSLAIHLFGDVITAYGTKVLAPFSDYRLALPTTFIIDIYFTGIIVLGLVLSFVFRQHAKMVALGGLFVLLIYVLLQNYWASEAREHAYASVPVDKLGANQIHVMPQPLSPWHWKVVIETEDHYYIRYLHLYRETIQTAQATDSMLKRINALYLPADEVQWELVPRYGLKYSQDFAKQIWQHDNMQAIRDFMMYPAVYRYDNLPDMQCIWFADQRFVLRNIRSPFVFGACQHKQSQALKFLQLDGDKPQPFS